MKTFIGGKGISKSLNSIVTSAKMNAKEVIAEQLYKDSNEFTYRESGELYKSGNSHSDFKNGLIIEKTPYARRRYYEGGKPGKGNKNAEPLWFEKTWNKNKTSYQKMFVKVLKIAKEKQL